MFQTMAMAVECNMDAFNKWLSQKLIYLNADDEVFSPYILSILDTEGTETEEKKEEIKDIMSDIVECDIDELCSEILSKWCSAKEDFNKKSEDNSKVALDEKLAQLIVVEESQIQKTNQIQTKKVSEESKKLKQAILSQYNEVSDEEVENNEPAPTTRNVNIESVDRAVKEKREKNKEEYQKKKEKDKEDRSKQKAKEDERKEKEKKRTQKGEKRR